jgi:integrase/recombinase XerD
MGKLRDLMEENLTLRGMSNHTKNCYLMRVALFAKHFNKNPEQMGRTEVKKYLLHLIQNGSSRSTVNVSRAAIKYLYETVLGREKEMDHLPQMKKAHTLPDILDQDEIKAIFRATKNIKHRAIFMLIYASGLRISETCNLLISDIDSKKMLVQIRQGKRGKDRYSILSKTALKILRQYWKAYQPKHFLFPGKTENSAITSNSVHQSFGKIVAKAKIEKQVSVHTLRHCFATHLLDSGVGLVHIQKLLGHNSIKSTSKYLHISYQSLSEVISPLDIL